MFASRISRSPARFDIRSRPELRDLGSFAPRPRGLTGPVPAPSPPIAPLPLRRFPLLQTKLRIGTLNDPLETEADSVADQVMRTGLTNVPFTGPRQVQRKCAACGKEEQEPAPPAPLPIRRKCAHCEEEEKVLRRTSDAPSSSKQSLSPEAPPLVHQVLRSPGQALAADDLDFFRSRFGFDFGHVHIHNDRDAAESAHSINALAYTSGSDIAFAAGQYQPGTETGRRLLAHELTHVVQQTAAGKALTADTATAPRNARAGGVSRDPMTSSAVQMKAEPGTIQRHKDDIVAYEGGQSSTMRVIQEGKLIYTAAAVSGHPGHGSNEVNVGPIPPGNYTIHPQITRPTVAKIQGGVCGANDISSGYQELTSTDKSPCDQNQHHYCNIPCPTPGNADQKCFTPVDCWGPMRIKIEGSQAVKSPTGATVIRNGFYIHGGNHADAVSSGCAKTLDNGIFAHIRKLTGVKGAVPFCVGAACPKTVQSAVLVDELSGLASGAADDLGHSLGELLP